MKKIITLGLAFVPTFAMAATIQGDILPSVSNILSAIVPILITLALIYFIWGVIQYIRAGDSEEDRDKARMLIIYGVIGLFAIVAVWGLVAMVQSTFGIQGGSNVNAPQADFGTGGRYGPGF